jgi:hypothetical protein
MVAGDLHELIKNALFVLPAGGAISLSNAA